MNKTITIYELLGLIKDGKIKHNARFRMYFTKELYRDFYYDSCETCKLLCLKNVSDGELFQDDLSLGDDVEILDEEDEFIEIEELLSTDVITVYTIGDKINQLIHNQKILIEKIKENNK